MNIFLKIFINLKIKKKVTLKAINQNYLYLLRMIKIKKALALII